MRDEPKSRPTKKQRELLDFIEKFVVSNGYGPSYREIMDGCNYKSVATVALHINNLIGKGHLRKKNRSARSLKVVDQSDTPAPIKTSQVKPTEEKWLVDKIDYRFRQAEDSQTISQNEFDGLQILAVSLKVLGLEGAAQSFATRLSKIKNKVL